MSKKHSRRDLLKLLGMGAVASASPVELLLDKIVDGIIHKAHASSSGNLTNKYILIQNYGAPPRWMYDLFLKPYGGRVVPNASVASEFVKNGNRYTDAKYATHDVKGIQAPRFWTHDVANGSGARRPVSDLMDNMLVLQGIDSLNPGHQPAAELVNRPLTQYSIDGVLADESNLPFGSLSLGTYFLDFKSAKGKSLKNFSSNQDMAALLPKAFESGQMDLEKSYSKEMNSAVEKLNRRVAMFKMGGVSLDISFSSAKKLMLGEINKIKTDYPALLAKYERIISETVELTKNLPGFSDLPIGNLNREDKDVNYRYSSGKYVLDNDLRNNIEGATILNLAKKFAVAEYAILNNLTSSVSLNADYARGRVNGAMISISNDQHAHGKMTSVFHATIFYRITSACILGLVDALKLKPYKGSRMFDHTVIRHAAEFGRHPRNTPANPGSDHSPWSANCMLLSGMIKGPIIAGDIKADGSTVPNRHAGSWGYGAYLQHGAPGTTGHVISTVAAMLGIPSPSVNNPSLVVKNEKGEFVLNEFYINKTKVV